MKKELTIQDLIDKIKTVNPEADLSLIQMAYDFASSAHEGQKRKSGEPYIQHPLATAMTLADWGMDDITITAGLLHDVPEDTKKSIKDIDKEFGREIKDLVEGITKLGRLKYRGIHKYIENLRRMFVAMAKDIRVILIKFADRLHNIETLNALPKNKQKRIALETLEIYAPIANRLGMGELKGKLEDVSFPFVMPSECEWVRKKIEKRLPEDKKCVEKMISEIKKILLSADIPFASVHGRTKHLYSLHMKLVEYNRDLSKIHDIIAIRVIVHTVASCYAVLGIIHEHYKPLKGRIKDYIAIPKPNGYQSLHTTVWSKSGNIVEIQIRTLEMHEQAEYGVAAHWHYKETVGGMKKALPLKERTVWIQQLLKLYKEARNEKEYFESLKLDIFHNRIFAFTPRGDVIDLPENSTPIDFAYHIHTDVGSKCCGAKVNEKIVALNTMLRSGDVVEIFTDKNRKGPSEDWLKFVKTDSARRHIRAYIRKHRFNITNIIKGLVNRKDKK